MCDLSEGVSDRAEAYLIATPEGLVEVFNAVDKALSSPKGCASVEFTTPTGESFTLHIVCQEDTNNA